MQRAVDAEGTIMSTIRGLLARRGAGELDVTSGSHLTAELGLESLELAELSAVLEDEFGRDPFTEGILPETVGDLVEFYRG